GDGLDDDLAPVSNPTRPDTVHEPACLIGISPNTVTLSVQLQRHATDPPQTNHDVGRCRPPNVELGQSEFRLDVQAVGEVRVHAFYPSRETIRLKTGLGPLADVLDRVTHEQEPIGQSVALVLVCGDLLDGPVGDELRRRVRLLFACLVLHGVFPFLVYVAKVEVHFSNSLPRIETPRPAPLRFGNLHASPVRRSQRARVTTLWIVSASPSVMGCDI